jgi:hypothetical protein
MSAEMEAVFLERQRERRLQIFGGMRANSQVVFRYSRVSRAAVAPPQKKIRNLPDILSINS